jgi:tetratricopeptide (TPR) repeat protein
MSIGRARAVRRLATVVHVLVEERPGADEERAAERAEALLDAAEAALADAGGLVLSRGVCAISAVFGAQGSGGDEPQRAADAARALAVAAEGVREVSVRAGIDTGRLLVRDRGASVPAVSGDVLTRAERLSAESAPGEVRASVRAARHLARRFKLVPAARSEAVIVADRLRAVDIGAGSKAFVGREREVARVAAALLSAAAGEGRAGAALVLGPPGIGKSRLEREVAELAAARGFTVVVASAEPDHAFAGYAVLSMLLRDVFGLTDRPSPAEAEAVARHALRAAGARGEDSALVTGLAALLGGRAAPERAAALAATKAALASACAKRPLLLVLDDAHWADDATLDLLEALARGEVEAHIAVLALARPLLAARRPSARKAFAVVLDLAPLGRADAEALAALHLGASGDLAAALAEASDGNPFFIEELARDRIERGAAEPTRALPSTVEEAIQARLDRLDGEEREVLRAASVLGRTFRRRDLVSMLVTATGASSAEIELSIDEVLRRLEARRIASALPPDALSDDRYALEHALLGDVAYRELGPFERRTLHAAAVRMIEVYLERDAEISVDRLAELGRHLDGAEQHAAAAAAYLRAGACAAAQEAPADALRCYARAREIEGPEACVDLLVGLGEAATQVGAYAEAERALDEAVARAAESPGARLSLGRALFARALLAKEVAAWDDAVALLRRGKALVEEGEDIVLSARLRGLLGWVLGYILGDNEHGLPESERAVALLDGTPHRAELAAAYSRLGANYMRAGRFRDQLACNQRTLEIGIEIGSIALASRAHLNLGVNLLALGRAAEAAEHSLRAIELYERMRATASIALGRNNLAFALVDLGELAAAERELDLTFELSDRCGSVYFLGEAECSRARIAAKRGDFESARAYAAAAVARSQANHGTIEEGIARRVLGDILSLAGEHDAAAEALEAADVLLRDSDLGEHARVRAAKARALSRRGEREAAARVRAEVRPVFERLGAMLDLSMLERDDWV